MSDLNPTRLEQNILHRLAELEADVRSLQRRDVAASQLSDIVSDLGVQDADGLQAGSVRSSASQIDINWWFPLGTMPDDDITEIRCFHLYTNGTTKKLYVGGDFQRIGGVEAHYIAVYDYATRQWSAVQDNSLNGAVYAIYVTAVGLIYIGGLFTTASGDANANYIAKASGSIWSALGTGASGGGVYALASDGTNIYAGGSFSSMGGVSNTSQIAMWNTSAWSALDTGLSSAVYCLWWDDVNSLLYVGGAFTNAGGIGDADYLAVWDGADWADVGAVFQGSVRALVQDWEGNLYAGGTFTDIDGDSDLAYLAKMDTGGTWAKLNVTSAWDDNVFALAMGEENHILIGGQFEDPDGVEGASFICKYHPDTGVTPLTDGNPLSAADYVTAVAADLETGNIFITGGITNIDGLECQRLAVFTRSLKEALQLGFSVFDLLESRYEFVAPLMFWRKFAAKTSDMLHGAGDYDGAVNGTLTVGGGAANGGGFSGHPGTMLFKSVATNNTGAFSRFSSTDAFYPDENAGLTYEAIFKVMTSVSQLRVQLGFQDDFLTGAAPANGATIRISGSTLDGLCRVSSSSYSTASTYTIATNTWYRIRVVMGLTTARFYLYDEAGVLLWQDTIVSTIPSTLVGAGTIAYRTNNVATDLIYLDRHSLWSLYDFRP